MNPKGTGAVTGGIDGSTLIYEWFTPDQKSDLAMVDLSTQTELDVPDGVNTNSVEFSPSISGSHLLFGRAIRHGASIVLFDTSSATSEVHLFEDGDRSSLVLHPSHPSERQLRRLGAGDLLQEDGAGHQR